MGRPFFVLEPSVERNTHKKNPYFPTHMETPVKSIQSLCVASLLVGACVLASPGVAAAQDTSPRQVKVEENANRQIDHQQADHPVASQQVVHQVNQVVQTGHVTRKVTTTRRGNRVITRTTRTHVLCEDGTW